MRLHPEISGFVVTQLTDVQWECNGLLDMDRNAKAGHAGYASLFAPDLPVAILDPPRSSVGARIEVPIVVAHSSQIDLARCEVRWRFGTTTGSVDAQLLPWSASRIGSIVLRPDQAGLQELDLELIDGSGNIIGKNTAVLLVLNAPTMPKAHSDEPGLASFLVAAGCPSDLSGAKVATTTGEGAGLILAGRGPFDLGGIRVAARDRTPWEGDWAQGLHWLGAELRRDTPLVPWMDPTWAGLVPRDVLLGADPDRTLSGLYVGWVRRPAATTVRLAECVATTIPLANADPADPLVRTILSRLLELAAL